VATLIAAFLASFLLAALPGGLLIKWLNGLGAKQTVSEDAPKHHATKQGTPTMGGLLFLVSTVLVTLAYLLWTSERNEQAKTLIPLLLLTVASGAIGFVDDYRKITRGRNLGLKAREKLVGQFLVAIGFVLWLAGTAQSGLTTSIQWTPPALGGMYTLDLGVFYYPLVLLFIVGFSNATNLTDGLDGLSGGISLLISIALTVLLGAGLFSYLNLFTVALAGGLAGFLWWNAHPAKVFMGDVGSLAIGAGLAGVAVIGKQEIGLIVASLVCWAEIFSDIIQVGVFKYRRKKYGIEYARAHRVFRRAPLHHHYEELGLAETQVVLRFWLVGAICLALALLWVRR
jgi:phospho-N-acetylmuramoyl-pentapeptide-transferase